MPTGAIQSPARVHAERFKRLAPWFAGLLVVVGVVMLIVTLTPSPSSSHSGQGSQAGAAPPPPPTPRSVPLSQSARQVAREFVVTAVARRNLAAAWKIAGPNIRGGLTYAEWKTGNIPVVPYPIRSVQYGAPFKIDYSYPNEALIEVALLPKPTAKIKPQIFSLLLRKLRGADGTQHWVVDNWAPHSSVPVPLTGNG